MKYALLIVDMVEEFVHGKLKVPSAEKIIPNIKDLKEAAKMAGVPVIYCNDAHRKGDPELDLWGEHAMEGSEGAKIVKDLSPDPDDYVVRKRTYNAFDGTELDRILKNEGVGEVIITGLVTSICCQHTAYGAFSRGYKVTVVEDACTDLDEKAHRNALEYMNRIYGAKIVNVEEVKEILHEGCYE